MTESKYGKYIVTQAKEDIVVPFREKEDNHKPRKESDQ